MDSLRGGEGLPTYSFPAVVWSTNNSKLEQDPVGPSRPQIKLILGKRELWYEFIY